MIDFRAAMSEKYNHDFTNYNDGKIGSSFFIMKLEEGSPGACYYQDANNRRQPRQTSRPNGVALTDVVFPYVQFEHPEFNRILTWIRQQTLTSKEIEDSDVVGVNTKGVFKDIHCIIDGFRFDFSTGGIHGSLNGVAVHSDDENDLIDIDVESFYPNIAIVNRLFPEHLSEFFL